MISVCLIVKDECEHLRKCLESLARWPFEVVVTDTGSTDDTIRMAKEYTDKVYQYAWTDDFSAARNYCISKANNDYILVLDADESVTELNYESLVQLVRSHPNEVGRIERINLLQQGTEQERQRECISRLFNRNIYAYHGRIHEQIAPIGESDTRMAIPTYLLPLQIEHTGYYGSEDSLREKAQRNIRLLKRQLEEGEDPYILYQIGKSYYMMHEYETACEWFERATTYDLDPKLEYVCDMILAYGYVLLELKQYEKALGFESIYQEFSYTSDFQFLMGLIYMNNAEFELAIQEFLKATKQTNWMVEGTNSFKAFYNIGVIYECLGHMDQAKSYYARCGSYQLAEQRIQSIHE